MTTIDAPLGIGVINGINVGLPIIAPATDETGKLRIANNNGQSGGGSADRTSLSIVARSTAAISSDLRPLCSIRPTTVPRIRIRR